MSSVSTLVIDIHTALARGSSVIVYFDQQSDDTGVLRAELNTLEKGGHSPLLEPVNVAVPEKSKLRALRLLIRRSFHPADLSPWPDPLTETSNGIEFYGTSRRTDGVLSLGPGDTTLDRLLPQLEGITDPYQLIVALADFAHHLFEDGKDERQRRRQRAA